MWAGFIFVNLDTEPRQSLREYLGAMVSAIEDYPFGRLSERYGFRFQLWECGWFHTYQHWPISHDKHVLEWDLHFAPPRNSGDVVAQEMTAVSLKEFALQDDSPIESIQLTLGSAGLTEFPLGDQEVLCRHLHQTAAAWVSDHLLAKAGP